MRKRLHDIVEGFRIAFSRGRRRRHVAIELRHRGSREIAAQALRAEDRRLMGLPDESDDSPVWRPGRTISVIDRR
jgi:hypothetical protein